MGLSKSEKFTDAQNNIAKLAKGLGHPARIAILEYIFTQDSCVCGDIVDEIGLAQATISQHLKELKKLGLIQGTISGTKVCYCINQEHWSALKSTLSQFLDMDLKKTTSCC